MTARAADSGGPTQRLDPISKGYRFIDYAVQLYLALVGLLILFFHRGRLPGWYFYVGAHALGIVLVRALIQSHSRRPGDRLLDILRHFYPIILYIAFYRETGELNRMFVTGFLDRFFINLDARIFGMQPSIAFMDALPYLPVSELFYMSYFSYYIMIAGVGAVLYFQDKRRFFHYVSIISFVFYICYLTYIFLPVVGPRVFWARVEGFASQRELPFYPLAFPEAVQQGPFFNIMKFIYEHLEAHGAAFPSSHVAVAVCTLYFTWRYIPKLRLVHVVFVTLLTLSTVYCRYHYAVDIFAGFATALVLLPVGERLYASSEHAALSALKAHAAPSEVDLAPDREVATD